MSNNEQLPKFWKKVQTFSMITCPGSFVGLKYLLDIKELAPWLKAEYVPIFGIPLLILFLGSCVFGSMKLLTVMGDLYSTFRKGSELIERRNRENESSE